VQRTIRTAELHAVLKCGIKEGPVGCCDPCSDLAEVWVLSVAVHARVFHARRTHKQCLQERT
jgi:hypothetical protein